LVFRDMRGISWLSEEVLATQEELWFIDLLKWLIAVTGPYFDPEESSTQLHTLLSFEYYSPVHSKVLQGSLAFVFTRQTFVCIRKLSQV